MRSYHDHDHDIAHDYIHVVRNFPLPDAGLTIRGLCGSPEDPCNLGDIYHEVATDQFEPCKYVFQTLWLSTVTRHQMLVLVPLLSRLGRSGPR